MRTEWESRGPEQAGRASRLLPVKHELGLDAAFVSGVETLGCRPASPVRQAAFSQDMGNSSPELCSRRCPCASRPAGDLGCFGL